MKPVYIKINKYGTRRYYSDAAMKTLHRTDGPAGEYADGTKAWYLNGVPHRTDGPAIEYPDGTKEWYLNGVRHRTDGPAIEYPDGAKEWYLNGQRMSIGEFLDATDYVVLTLDEIAAKFGISVENLKIAK